MYLQAGIVLKSTLVNDETFTGATILITEYNDEGAVGFIINQPSGRYLNELEEFRDSLAFPLYNGGPVDHEHLFILHQKPVLIPGGTPIGNNLFMGGDFKQAINHINDHTLTAKDIRIFIGYCGWNAGDLESEINEGSWELAQGAVILG
jgi:putative transcriptional regulator